jgi:hypothetical protein
VLIFSQSKHIIPYTGFISLPVGEGYMTLSKDDYEDILYVAHTATEMELLNRFGEPCKALSDILPHSLAALAYLPSLLSFDIGGLDTSQLIGCCAVVLVNKRFRSLLELSADDFSVLRFSEYILKEYQIPWKYFLDTCIPSDEFGKPADSLPGKYIFLSLHPGQASALPGAISPHHMAAPVPAAAPPGPVRAEWEEYTENPDMTYVGSGAFMNKSTFRMFEISGYDEAAEKLIRERLRELGRGIDDEGGENAKEAAAEAKPAAVFNPPGEAEEIRWTLFNRPGG